MPRDRDKSEPASVYNVWTSFAAGKAFYANAGDFFSTLPTVPLEAAKAALQQPGRLIASVTNLALGIELYLKCLALLTASRVHQTHDLLTLFKALPDNVRASLETRYKLKVQNLPPGSCFALVVRLSMGRSDEQGSHSVPDWKSAGDDLQTLLSNGRDAFQTWRYLYEGGGDTAKLYHVEYLYLGVCARVLEEHIDARTPRMHPKP